MGQHLELIFLSDDRIEHDKLSEELVKAGVTGEKWGGYLKGGGYGQMTWACSVKPLDLVVANYEGNWNKHFVTVGFDSAVFRGMTTPNERKRLVDEFLKLGSELWRAFPFYEGALSPEEEGPLLYSLRQSSTDEMRRLLPLNHHATFLSAAAAQLVNPYQWIPQAHPHSIITPQGRDGLLVIWDASSEGFARFLSEEFSIN